MEKPNILHLRYKYIRAIKKYRNENRPIIYLDETWVDTDLTFKKCWQSEEVFGIIENIGSQGRFIVVHAGGKDGFVNGASLVFKAGVATGDYHGQMNEQNFIKWITEKLLPNIPNNSVIVFDNAPYHSVIDKNEKIPTKSSLKKDIMDWLTKNNIPFEPSTRKVELYELVCAHKPKNDDKKYKIDKLLKDHGHIPLRTPPYMCELNPIELAWAEVKRLIRSKNIGDFTPSKLLLATQDAINSIGSNLWEKFVEHVIKIENKYWETDQHMEEVTERIIITIGPNDDDDSDEFSTSESEEDDSE